MSNQGNGNNQTPTRRQVLGAGLAVATLGGVSAIPLSAKGAQAGSAAANIAAAGGIAAAVGGCATNEKDAPLMNTAPPGKSPWGDETYKEPAIRPVSVRPGEQSLPTHPRKYTDISSYHAHIYFDEDSYEKAALVRKWVIERFSVELGHWNVAPVGPHVTPSFYFGFMPDLLPILIPWLQLNSLGLTILIHPNTVDPRADHLHYALWINRSQPVDAYDMENPSGEVEQIYPNTKPTLPVET